MALRTGQIMAIRRSLDSATPEKGKDSNGPIQLFIGSSEVNLIEEQVFRYSLETHTSQNLQINTIDATTGCVKFASGLEKEFPSAMKRRVKGATNFSLARYAIPEWCDFTGRAIYCDSDQIVFDDIFKLWNFELGNCAIAAVPVQEAFSSPHYEKHILNDLRRAPTPLYLTSVMLLDCSKLSHWRVESFIVNMDQGAFRYREMMFLEKPFCDRYPVDIAGLPSYWNHLDRINSETRLLHFTDLTSQPWLFPHNSTAHVWEQYFLAAISAGYLNSQQLSDGVAKRAISNRIAALPYMHPQLRFFLNWLWRNLEYLGLPALSIKRGLKTAKSQAKLAFRKIRRR
ncbi:MAG: glycosyltransferase [Cyanobacteria bacterium P01_H01_bin.15]